MLPESEIFEIEQLMIAEAKQVSAPLFVHMLGIPGSGKTSFLEVLEVVWRSNHSVPATFLGFDQVMQAMLSYQKTGDKVEAFAKYELPARSVGYRLLEGILKKRAHIFFDNGGSAESHPDMMLEARNTLGYRLVFVSIEISLEEALKRVHIRAIGSGQHTPSHYLEERHIKLQKLIPVYEGIAHNFYRIQNDGADIDLFQQKSQDVAREICELVKGD